MKSEIRRIGLVFGGLAVIIALLLRSLTASMPAKPLSVCNLRNESFDKLGNDIRFPFTRTM